MYKRARAAEAKGELAEAVPNRPMKIFSAELISIEKIIWEGKKRLSLQVRFLVGSGTYIRSLGRNWHAVKLSSDAQGTKADKGRGIQN